MEKPKILLCPNAERDVLFQATLSVGEMLKKRGREFLVCPLFGESSNFSNIPPNIKTFELEDSLRLAELIITFGGDGTILRAARVAAKAGVPILGVNMGGKGFMTELESSELEGIAEILSGEYNIERRMMLDVEVSRNGKMFFRDFSLNDVVVRGDNKVIDLALFADGQKISYFFGDGAVISTPTGSTAYSMAAGGPIVEPTAHNIIVTPICAHILEAKSVVLASSRRVSVEIGVRKNNPAYLSVDGGKHLDIQSGDIVSASKSEMYANLVCLSKGSFYQKVGEKLGEKFI